MANGEILRISGRYQFTVKRASKHSSTTKNTSNPTTPALDLVFSVNHSLHHSRSNKLSPSLDEQLKLLHSVFLCVQEIHHHDNNAAYSLDFSETKIEVKYTENNKEINGRLSKEYVISSNEEFIAFCTFVFNKTSFGNDSFCFNDSNAYNLQLASTPNEVLGLALGRSYPEYLSASLPKLSTVQEFSSNYLTHAHTEHTFSDKAHVCCDLTLSSNYNQRDSSSLLLNLASFKNSLALSSALIDKFPRNDNTTLEFSGDINFKLQDIEQKLTIDISNHEQLSQARAVIVGNPAVSTPKNMPALRKSQLNSGDFKAPVDMSSHKPDKDGYSNNEEGHKAFLSMFKHQQALFFREPDDSSTSTLFDTTDDDSEALQNSGGGEDTSPNKPKKLIEKRVSFEDEDTNTEENEPVRMTSFTEELEELSRNGTKLDDDDNPCGEYACRIDCTIS